jgi:SAM-dependent methyltransferase
MAVKAIDRGPGRGWQHDRVTDAQDPGPDEGVGTPTAEDRRLSFGATAAAYDRYRPGYAADALRWALGPSALRVVDLAAGTGLMTEVLTRLGHRVVAVEPDAAMRQQLGRRTGGTVPALDGTAESIPLDDASVDAVVVGQAFHWFEPDAALPEMARVLVPGGRLVLVWNHRNDDVGWVREMSSVVGRLDARSGNRDEDVPAVAPTFTALERGQFPYEQELDVDELVGLVSTYSYVTLSQHRDQVLARIRTIAEGHPDLAGATRFTLPYDTVVYRARKV